MQRSLAPTWNTLALLATIAFSSALSGACSTDKGATTEEDTEAVVEDAMTAGEEIVAPESFPDVVATVNGTEIRRSELLARAASIEAQAPPSRETSTLTFYRDVLDELVGAELLYQASRDRDLAVDPAAVDRQIGALRGRFPDPAVFEQALAQQGLTLDQLRTQMERDMSIQKLIETDVVPLVNVTDQEKRTFYDENTDKLRQPDRLRLSHILKRVAPDAPPQDRDTARRALESVLEQAQSGADFAELAREHSEDPGSAANGGELVVGRGETVPPFEEAAFALEPGGLSSVVETQFGFHIIKLTEKIAGQLVPYDDVQPRIEEFLTQQAVQKEVASTVESLKEAAAVELFI